MCPAFSWIVEPYQSNRLAASFWKQGTSWISINIGALFVRSKVWKRLKNSFSTSTRTLNLAKKTSLHPSAQMSLYNSMHCLGCSNISCKCSNFFMKVLWPFAWVGWREGQWQTPGTYILLPGISSLPYGRRMYFYLPATGWQNRVHLPRLASYCENGPGIRPLPRPHAKSTPRYSFLLLTARRQCGPLPLPRCPVSHERFLWRPHASQKWGLDHFGRLLYIGYRSSQPLASIRQLNIWSGVLPSAFPLMFVFRSLLSLFPKFQTCLSKLVFVNFSSQINPSLLENSSAKE